MGLAAPPADRRDDAERVRTVVTSWLPVINAVGTVITAVTAQVLAFLMARHIAKPQAQGDRV